MKPLGVQQRRLLRDLYAGWVLIGHPDHHGVPMYLSQSRRTYEVSPSLDKRLVQSLVRRKLLASRFGRLHLTQRACHLISRGAIGS